MSLFPKGIKPQGLLDLACETRVIQHDGSRALRGDAGLGRRWDHIIAHYIKGTEHTEVKLQAVTNILHKQQNWSVSEFEREYRCEIIRILNPKNIKEFVVAFPVIAHSSIFSQLPKFQRERIRFQKENSSKFSKLLYSERRKQRDENKGYFENEFAFKEDYVATCRCDAISAFHAQSIAQRNIEFIIGLIVFLTNYTEAAIINGPPKPISDTLIAPHISVHSRDGRIATKVFWFENWARHFGKSTKPPSETFNENFKFLYSRINDSPWREDCIDAIQIYFNALREQDRTNSFLGLWRVLERIGGDGKTSSDMIIERAAFFYEEAEQLTLKGRYFKDIRNSVTHAQDNKVYESGDIALSFKEFIRPLFRHFLANYHKFNSKEELWEFCSADVRPDRLIRRAEILNKAVKFRGLEIP